MAQITGSTGSLPSHYAYWIDWVEDNVDTVNNTSRVTATVYVQKVGSYNVEGSQNSHTLYIDGTPFTANPYIDMNPETTPRVLVSGQKTITHNSDGSKSINISSSGQITYIPGAYYSPQSGSASATVGLTNIPREASITNSVNYTIGNSVPLTFSNPGGMYMKVRAYVWDGTDWEPYIKDQNMGNGTSGTYTFDSGDLADIYTQLGNNLQASCKFRVYSYTGSDYSSGYVGYKDKDGTAYIDQNANKPTFTDFDVANYDKSIAVKDKYNNTLTTSSTSTLLGSNDKAIKGYSKLRGTVAVADKMVPKNGATGIKYRFATPTQYAEGAYSAVADVNMDLDNVITKDVSVTAYDSRGLTTTVNKSLSYLAEYVPVSLWGLTLVRDNGVDSETKLQISGSFWKQYFGGGTSGVQNTVTAHWRYKPTGDSWASQTWNSITLTDDGSGNLSYDDYIDGDLGASGFDTEASFDIEVRIYDKLTATIVEQTLSVGTPVIDITKEGVSFGSRYDPTLGGNLQVEGLDIVKEIKKPKVWFWQNGNDVTWSQPSSGWYDDPNFNIEVTLEEETDVLLTLSLIWYNNSTYGNSVGIKRETGGVYQSSTTFSSAQRAGLVGRHSGCWQWLEENVPAGTHVYQVRYAPSGSLNPNVSTEHRSLRLELVSKQ